MFSRNIDLAIKRAVMIVMVVIMCVVNSSNGGLIFTPGYITSYNPRITIPSPTDMINSAIGTVIASVTPDKSISRSIEETTKPSITETEIIEVSAVADEVIIEEVIPTAIEPVEITTPEVTEPVVEEVIVEETVEEPIVNSVEEASNTEYDFSQVPLSEDLIQAMVQYCEEFGVPIAVALGVMDVESNFDTTARNGSSGCYGLMQLHPKYFNITDDPAQNIHDGLEYLGSNITKYGDIRVALNVYNAGHVTGDTSYPNKVMADAEYWSEITGAPLS